jgi:hypothetical protein
MINTASLPALLLFKEMEITAIAAISQRFHLAFALSICFVDSTLKLFFLPGKIYISFLSAILLYQKSMDCRLLFYLHLAFPYHFGFLILSPSVQ